MRVLLTTSYCILTEGSAVSICNSATNSPNSLSAHHGADLLLIMGTYSGPSGLNYYFLLGLSSKRLMQWDSLARGLPLVLFVGKDIGGSISPSRAAPSPYVARARIVCGFF